MSYIYNELWVNTVLMAKLKNIEPSLDVQGNDKRVLQICINDFKNYTEYLKKVSVATVPILESFEVEVCIDIKNSTFEVVDVRDQAEMMEVIDVWVKMWWKKWKNRVKLVIAKDSFKVYEKSDKMSKKGRALLWKLNEDERNEIRNAAKHTLIKNGEICCTDVIASSLLNITLGKQTTIVDKLNDEQKINLMNSIMREARNMSRTSGPLVFLRPDKQYYKIREYRDDGEGSKPQGL